MAPPSPPGRPDLRRILRETRTIAVLGASANPWRASYDVYTYLVGTGGLTVYPVNPTIAEIDGAPTYPTLLDLPAPVDMVNVFRRASELPGVLAEVLSMPVPPKTLWLQLGLRDDGVARAAEDAGITTVMDRCLMVDHAALA